MRAPTRDGTCCEHESKTCDRCGGDMTLETLGRAGARVWWCESCIDDDLWRGGQGRESQEVATYGARIAWLGFALLAAVAASGLWFLWRAL